MELLTDPSVLFLLVAGLCAATFMAVLVWLVRSEGQRTREALREASRQTASDVREEIQHEATSTVEQVARTSGEAIRELKTFSRAASRGDLKKNPPAGAAAAEMSRRPIRGRRTRSI